MIDTHCHIDMYPNPHSVLAEIARERIVTVAVTNLPSHFLLAFAHVRAAQSVRLALGLHPLLVEKHSATELRKFKELAATTSYIGEVGLDYSREGRDTAGQQVVSFRFVLDTVCDRPRFVTLHSRGAEAEVFRLLGEYGLTSCGSPSQDRDSRYPPTLSPFPA